MPNGPAIWVDDVEFAVEGDFVRILARSENVVYPARLQADDARKFMARLIAALDAADARAEGGDVLRYFPPRQH